MRSRLALAAVVTVAAFAPNAQAYVYWASGTSIGRANLDGSGISHSFLTGTGPSEGVLTYGTHIYWGDGGSIERANLNGTGAQQLITTDTSPLVTTLVTDGTYLYWVTDGTDIYRAALDGSGVTDLIKSAGTSLQALTVVNGEIYYPSGSTIEQAPAGGGSPIPIISLTGLDGASPPTILGITNANGVLYWTELSIPNGSPPFGDIGEAPLNNTGGFNETFITTPKEPGAIASDGTYLYWSDVGSIPKAISRAAIAAPTSPVTDFITELGGANSVAVDAGIDPTTTNVICAPATLAIGQAASCTATVSDTASNVVPTGTVNFSGNGSAFFSGSPCQLTPRPGGGATCTAGADLTSAGEQTVTASYSGDSIHQASSGAARICAGTQTQCGAPPPPTQKCVVPKLRGKSLMRARTLLDRAHCQLGKVSKPKHKRGPLVVGSTRPNAGTSLAAGAKVAIRLTPRPKARHR